MSIFEALFGSDGIFGDSGFNNNTYGSTYTGFAPDTIPGTDMPVPTRETFMGLTPEETEAYYGRGQSGREDRPPTPLEQARSARSGALSRKRSELAKAFEMFNDDYYDDLSRSYSDFNDPLLSSAYDDALRGIYQGFKSAGILSQADLDAQIASLDAQKGIESQRLADNALSYTTTQRDQVEKERQKLTDQLSALAGGATSIDGINQQTSDIENFDIAGRVNKLKSPNTKTSMNFFADFAKVPETAMEDPVATFAGTPSPVSQTMMGQDNPFAGLGIQTPYQGSATKVIS